MYKRHNLFGVPDQIYLISFDLSLVEKKKKTLAHNKPVVKGHKRARETHLSIFPFALKMLNSVCFSTQTSQVGWVSLPFERPDICRM